MCPIKLNSVFHQVEVVFVSTWWTQKRVHSLNPKITDRGAARGRGHVNTNAHTNTHANCSRNSNPCELAGNPTPNSNARATITLRKIIKRK